MGGESCGTRLLGFGDMERLVVDSCKSRVRLPKTSIVPKILLWELTEAMEVRWNELYN